MEWTLESLLAAVKPGDKGAAEAAWKHWDALSPTRR